MLRTQNIETKRIRQPKFKIEITPHPACPDCGCQPVEKAGGNMTHYKYRCSCGNTYGINEYYR